MGDLEAKLLHNVCKLLLYSLHSDLIINDKLNECAGKLT